MEKETVRVVISVLVMTVMVLGIGYCMVTAPGLRPERTIMIEGVTPGVDVNGNCLILRYFVDGTEAFAVLRDEAEVESFKEYLGIVGRVLYREEVMR